MFGVRAAVPRAHAIAALVALASLAGAAHGAAAQDSLRVRFEFGAATDVSNELFYEESFTDTTFLGRQLRSTPETRTAAVALAELVGARGRLGYRAAQELSLGDRLQRGAWSLFLSRGTRDEWRFSLDPRLEYRHDETFDRDLRELRGGARARARRLFQEGETALEFGGATDMLRSSGAGSQYILDRNAGGGFVQITRTPLLGPEWRARYGLDARAFPDSTHRDHFEHHGELGFRRDAIGGHSFAAEAALDRRVPIYDAVSTRDRFIEYRIEIQGTLRKSDGASWTARSELEVTSYDQPDSLLYFDYRTYRLRLGPRLSLGPGASLWLGPRAEWLRAGLPTEDYDEVGAQLEWERFSGGAWWSIAPAAGWRGYHSADRPSEDDLSSHSSYAFYEVQCLADQPLPGRLRVRAIATGRLEYHIDPSQDARSLYFSVDVRRLF